MANRTVPGALHIHGIDPQHLVEKITRERIYDSLYWKEECFALSAATVIEKACSIHHTGGLYGNQRPTPFLCLLLKLLQLQPDKDIILEYIKNEEFKYLRALGAFYLRMVGTSKEIYTTLEPLLADYRKLRERTPDGFVLTHMDEFIDRLLIEERVFNIILPRLTKRSVLEEVESLALRVSPIEQYLSEDEEDVL